MTPKQDILVYNVQHLCDLHSSNDNNNNHTGVSKNVPLQRADPGEGSGAVRAPKLVWRVSIRVSFALHHR